MNNSLRPKTVKLIARLIKPLVEENLILVSEEQIMLSNLKHLAEKGELLPAVMPKLIDQREAAEMLGVSLANFKKLERENAFPFKRKMLGSSVRYRNTDLIAFTLSQDENS
jgi:predicted DNA-binding transcriptional regulator AlpA